MADFGVVALAMTQGISSFNSFLPKITEVRKGSANDPDFVADVRTGEVAGLVVTLGVGAICSSLTQSVAPTVVALITGLLLIVLYEVTLRAGSERLATAVAVTNVGGLR